MRKPILSIFNTYCDAYLEFRNNFLTPEAFVETYGIDENEFKDLLDARKIQHETKNAKFPIMTIDYFFNTVHNKNYTETSTHY